VLVAITAIALVSGSPAGARAVRRGVVLLAVAAGVMFGLLFVLLDRVDPASGVWSLVGTRAGSIALGVLLYARRGRVRLTGGPIRWTVLAGVLDISANACFVVAVHLGALSVVGPVASLYPASTVLLALTVEWERVGPTQLVGLGLAATALVLVAA
jgi:drug/metabolite transporter (DMT)-like permease